MSYQKIFYPEIVKKLPTQVHKIFNIFIKEGDEIRLVGGCVRDLLLEIEVNDFDFATKLLPQQIIEILNNNDIKAIPTGIEFGTITAVIDGKNFEITTLRQDEKTDGRHCKPKFIDDYFCDAARRDFTINALYLSEKGFVYDYFDGIYDLKNKEVKFIGNPDKRISEDYLRILRFFRFSCKYAENLDKEGLKACVKQKENLKKLSRERLRLEFLKLILSERKNFLTEILYRLQKEKIIEQLFSCEIDVENLEKLFVFAKIFNVNLNDKLKLAALFLFKVNDWKVFYSEICATNLEKKYFQFLIKAAFDNKRLDVDEKILKNLLVYNDKNLVLDFYIFYLLENLQENTKILNNLFYIKEFILPKFPLTGEDIKNLGYQKKDIGKLLQQAKYQWIEGDFLISKEKLINFITNKNLANSS